MKVRQTSACTVLCAMFTAHLYPMGCDFCWGVKTECGDDGGFIISAIIWTRIDGSSETGKACSRKISAICRGKAMRWKICSTSVGQAGLTRARWQEVMGVKIAALLIRTRWQRVSWLRLAASLRSPFPSDCFILCVPLCPFAPRPQLLRAFRFLFC